MSTPDKSIDPKLLECAKKEFLKNGFLNASLKSICDAAGITTGAVYKRYKGKEELFCAVVETTIKQLTEFIAARSDADFASMSDAQIARSWMMDEPAMLETFKLIWKQRRGFVLLLDKSAGTRYENFRHDFVEMMSKTYELIFSETRKRGLARADLSAKELHVLCSSFWTSVYEPFIHAMTWEEIEVHCRAICRFFDWPKVIGLTRKGG